MKDPCNDCPSLCRPSATAPLPAGSRCRHPHPAWRDAEFPRLISVCSLGLVMVGAGRQLDRLLETIAVCADTQDATWIE
jgi:hypothetical protein